MRTFRTLLSGGELFGVGARAAGYTHIDGYEVDPKIAAVAQQNGFDVRAADICQIDYTTLPPADHLHGSTVCTRASSANVGAAETEADLAMADAVCRAIAAHQGQTFSLENVWAYRAFESFDRIRDALATAGFSYEYWHLNAADYGVPQTRKRLILIARRGVWRIQRPPPTHRHGGDMFHAPWVGWYAAITDILHTLPATRPAPWQVARMPEALRESTLFPSRMSHDHDGNCYGPQRHSGDEPAQTLSTMTPGWYKAYLIGAGGYDGEVVNREGDEPAFTMTSTDNSQQLRAFLVGDQRAGSSDSVQVRAEDEPALTVRSLGVSGGAAPRAYIVSSGSDGHRNTVPVRSADEPVMTTTPNADGRMRAFLLDGDNASRHSGEPGYRAEDEPAMSIRSSRTPAHRAYTAGRWVKMTVQALGRFQTVPDSYQGLTAQINGNGVPCLLAQRIMESLL